MIKNLLPALRRRIAHTTLCAVLTVLTAAFAACSKSDDNPVPDPSESWTAGFAQDPDADFLTCENKAGNLSILLYVPSGTAYSMTVVSDGGWCKTSMQQNETSVSGTTVGSPQAVYLYYEANTGLVERTATVSIALGGRTPIVLTVRQKPGTAAGEDEVVLANKRWAELPVCVETGDAKIVTHFAPLAVDKTVRNFTLRYDTRKRIADWVAYPIHGCYMSGSYKRSDAWQYDPSFPAEQQANLALGSYQNSSTTGVRGHQCMSNHRYCPYSATLNQQTFYSTNIMPQNYDFNSGLWGQMETVCTRQSCADTLYCVTGNFGVQGYTADKEGKPVAIPEYCFKVLLRTVSGTTGKSIDTFTDASQLKAIGYIAHNSTAGNKGALTDYCVSVAEVERRSGFSFFTLLDASIADQVKSQCDPKQWGIN